MKFNPRARFDTSQVRRQGRSSGGGGGLSTGGFSGGRGMPGGIGLPTGGIGLVLVIGFFLFTQFSSGGGGLGLDPAQVAGGEVSDCDSGGRRRQQPGLPHPRNREQRAGLLGGRPPRHDHPRVRGERHSVVLRLGQDRGCGTATSAVGPFYCPADQSVYIDTTFFDAMLEGQLGATGGDFAEAYVIAHEYGHHVQNLLGTMDQVRGGTGADSDAVALELQADCYAGMWAKHATQTEDENGEVFILELTQEDVAEAIDAAEAVGDDRIQQRAEGQVRPETWTHGSAAERREWFTTGFTRGTMDACDTFAR
jgi:predicted metalloprotease